ncbi:MAG TPA: aminotransferase class V-fold PLP-dependent enzyme [Chitinophagaceae bacterium]|nr:aminotransferase class V-fold PLP-dependent enzyme [Chitinophagaceae bacterium]
MISEIVNLSTGPVAISPKVMNAFKEPPISHRSAAFKKLYNKTTRLLSAAFHVQQTFLLTGSGTLANEVMLQEIKCIQGKGLILSNGEFGERLIEQARRNNLKFIKHEIDWGKPFNLEVIKQIVLQKSVKWILFAHCETSTGVINDLDQLLALAKSTNCLGFVDCMSTVGTMPLNLSQVAMATASSGKGLASVPGLAIIFANIELSLKRESPVYLDLTHYSTHAGIPFTLSSNLVKALYASIFQKLRAGHYELIQHYGEQFFKILNDHGFVPFSDANSKVFTIVTSGKRKSDFYRYMKQKKILLSNESKYLTIRGWCQLATLGYYTEKQLRFVLNAIRRYSSEV